MLLRRTTLRCAVINSTGEVDSQLRQAIHGFADVSIVDTVEGYPNKVELTYLLRTTTPDMIFISTDSVAGCALTAEVLKDLAPRTPVVAIGKSCGESILTTLLDAGCDEYLAAPIELSCLRDCLERVRSQRRVCLQASVPAGVYSSVCGTGDAVLHA